MVTGVATISRLLKSPGLFCRISSLLYASFAKATHNFKEPTNRSHHIPITLLRPERRGASFEALTSLYDTAPTNKIYSAHEQVLLLRNSSIPVLSAFSAHYGVNTISRLLQIYRSLLQKSPYKSDYILQKRHLIFKEPTNRSHPIFLGWVVAVLGGVWVGGLIGSSSS